VLLQMSMSASDSSCARGSTAQRTGTTAQH
jgi:hypothetical protein